MKRFIPLLAIFAAGVAASIALASPSDHGNPSDSTSTSTSPGHSGEHGPRCRPVILKGTVDGGTITVNVTKSDPHSQLTGAQTLTVKGNVSVQAWSCAAGAGSTAAPTLFLRQLHAGGKPPSGG
jgi:hypothetical protein